MKWTHLRHIQVEAIHKILRDSVDLVISAHTAGGKTEAAFLPILSQIIEDSSGGIAAIYVGPLKALINDQFQRLEDLCKRTAISVHRWHGDVGQSQKKKLLTNPSGVLLITPESIESLFINHPNEINKLFGKLRFIVIDEMHSFMGVERGAHLKSLISRLLPRSKVHVRLVGLSATLGDMELSKQWMNISGDRDAYLIEDAEEEKQIKYLIKGYIKRTVDSTNHRDGTDRASTDLADENLTNDIFNSFNGKTALIFSNSKQILEQYADLIKRKAEKSNLSHNFLIHHGSLSKNIREETESELRSHRPTAVFCSSTLEMGIDVGDVEQIGHIGAPFSVNSLTQRLGRSGRKDSQPRIMWMYVLEHEIDKNSSIIERLHPHILEAIAVTELMLEKWCEPPDVNKLHLSTTVHQVMSVIAEHGGINLQTLFDTISVNGAFSNITQKMFVDILRDLKSEDIVEQTPEGDIILGMLGERIVRRYDFYAAFQTEDEYQVRTKDQSIGGVFFTPGLLAEGFLILSGRRWKILDVDEERKVILVEHAKGGRLPSFRSRYSIDTHPKIRSKMFEILYNTKIPKYLDATAIKLLSQSREYASDCNLGNRSFFTEGSDTYWFTWTGSRINQTLLILGNLFGDLKVHDELIALRFEDSDKNKARDFYLSFLHEKPSESEFVEKLTNFATLNVEKFDYVLSREILAQAYVNNYLDISGAFKIVEKMLS